MRLFSFAFSIGGILLLMKRIFLPVIAFRHDFIGVSPQQTGNAIGTWRRSSYWSTYEPLLKRLPAGIWILPVASAKSSISQARRWASSRLMRNRASDADGEASNSGCCHLLGLRMFYNAYKDSCERKPLLTKAITQSMIGGMGSILSQSIIFASSYHHGSTCTVPYCHSIDWTQVRAFMTSGLFFEGPYFHWWYERLVQLGKWLDAQSQPIMDRMNNVNNNNKTIVQSARTVIQIIVDQTVGVFLFFPTYFFLYEIIQSGWALRVPNLMLARERLNKELVAVLRTNYIIWPVADWIIFRHVPQSLRVLASSIVAIFWNAFLCSRVAV